MTLLPLLAAAALAATPAQRKIAVFDLEATGVEPTLAQAASFVLPTEIRRRNPGAHVISSADVQAMLGLEKQKTMLGCGSAECFAEIGGALGAEELVSGRLGKVGKTYVLELRITDVKKARAVASAVRTVKGEEDALLEAIRDAVAEMYAAGAKPSLAAAPPAAAPAAPAPTSTAISTTAAPADWPSRTGSWLLTVGGGVLFLASGVGLAAAAKVGSDYDAQQAGTPGTATVTRADADRAKKLYVGSWIGLAAGGALTTWGIYRLVKYPATPALSVAPLPGGAAVALGGSF